MISGETLFFLQVIDYCTLPVVNPVAERRRALIRNMWTERIQGTKQNVEVVFCFFFLKFLILFYLQTRSKRVIMYVFDCITIVISEIICLRLWMETFCYYRNFGIFYGMWK